MKDMPRQVNARRRKVKRIPLPRSLRFALVAAKYIIRSSTLLPTIEVIREGNLAIRDLLLTKGYLIPPELLNDAGMLVEHYDRWLEEFEKKRSSEEPDLDSAFVFVGPQGFRFPSESEAKFKDKFGEI